MADWLIQAKKADFKGIADRFGISPVLARIIRNRDIITDEEIDEYLNGDKAYMHDPEMLSGVKEACCLIVSAINNKEKIRIMGDYDIDGVCASYILKKVIKSIGGDADIAIPNRVSDGYGMNADMVNEAAEDGVKLIITCDNGIKAHEAVERARELGVKVIVTDHHEVPEVLPAADVVINPHIKGCGYPFEDLCGAAVAYKLLCALAPGDPNLDEALMFAGMATIGDIVPLRGENRVIAKEGLKRIRQCTNMGLSALIEEKGVDEESIEAYHIGFLIGPCINSAGRLKDADIAIKLLESENKQEAYLLAKELVLLNDERKELTDKSARAAEAYFNDRMLKYDKLDKVLVIYMPEAHESIAGIIAGRLKERFNRPAFVITDSKEDMKGSGRSIEAYNMIEAISAFPQLFKHAGGHKMACGFTLNEGKLEEFKQLINSSCELTEDELRPKKWIDMQLPIEYITEDLIAELNKIKPYGSANKKPVFADKGIKVRGYNVLGQNRNVLKLFLEGKTGVTLNGMIFGSSDRIAEVVAQLEEYKKEKGSQFEIACLYYPEINEFRDMRSIQLRIEDIDISR